MSGSSSRKLAILFLAVVAPPAVTLVWLGLRLIEQDRSLWAQRDLERRQAARLGQNESALAAKGDRPVWTGLKALILERISPDRRYLTYGDWNETGNRVRLPADQIARALASYVRSILSGDSPFDHFVNGDRSALSPEQQLGLQVFRGKGNCTACHVGPNFTDESLHNTGVAWRHGALADPGAGQGNFKTPTLREVARSAPYMHDGSLATLEDVIDFYDRGRRPNPHLDSEIRPLRLTAKEKKALAAFLRSLTGVLREGRFVP